MTTRDEALARDSSDPLARFRDEFVVPDPELIYLDGNSLGRLPKRSVPVLEKAIHSEWGHGLVRSWHDWIGLSQQAGDELAPLIGGRPGEVLVCDQTSINLFKLAAAALRHTGRGNIIADDSNFPSDRYVLDAVARAAGGEMREANVDAIQGPSLDDLSKHVDESIGLISLSLVAFKSGAIADIEAITKLAHDHGALVLWDLSHAAGAIPVDLHAVGADLAVGCTYKYLNGGPGAPAFLFVREDLQLELEQPIPGWFGHDAMFAFEGGFRPAPNIRRFSVGTPPVLSLRAAQSGISVTAEAGMEALRAKSVSLTELLIERFDARLADRGFSLASPRDPSRRGSHVSIDHPRGYGVTQALIDRNIVPDFRAPHSIRIGIAPLYNTHREVWDAVEAIADIVDSGEDERYGDPDSGAVT